jgi:polysaccharide export outer membrane protein
MASCVTNKKTQYLQKEDVNREPSQSDSLVRKYETFGGSYKIQPNDILHIQVKSITDPNYNFFELNNDQPTQNMNTTAAALNGHLVDPSGKIDFPVVGKVHVAGLTIIEVQDEVKKIAARFIRDPVVNARIVNFRFSVLGEVMKEVTVTTLNNDVTLFEAISLAGGLTELADRANIKLIRYTNGTSEVRYLNLLEEEFLESDNIFIHQRDVLVVPPLRQKPFKTNFGPNLALILASLSTILLTINLFNQ